MVLEDLTPNDMIHFKYAHVTSLDVTNVNKVILHVKTYYQTATATSFLKILKII